MKWYMERTPGKAMSVELSMNTVFKIIVILAVLWFLYLIRDIVTIVFFSILFILILQPPVQWLNTYRVPRALAVLIMYTLVTAFFVFAVLLVIPPIINESQQVVQVLGQYTEQVFKNLGFVVQDGFWELENVKNLENLIPNATSSIFSQLTGFVGALVTLSIVLVITFYGLVEESAFRRIIRSFVPSAYQPYLYHVANSIQRKLGQWMRGQLLLALIIFILTYLGLWLLQVPYALVLALIAGMLEFIPYVGPIISGALAIFLMIFSSPFKALLVLILFVLIQQIENHLLVPKIMQRTTGLNPVVSIIALLIGGKLGGVVGLLLAIPVTLVVSVFISDILESHTDNDLEVASI